MNGSKADRWIVVLNHEASWCYEPTSLYPLHSIESFLLGTTGNQQAGHNAVLRGGGRNAVLRGGGVMPYSGRRA